VSFRDSQVDSGKMEITRLCRKTALQQRGWKWLSRKDTSTTAPSSHDVTAKYSSIPGNISSILRSFRDSQVDSGKMEITRLCRKTALQQRGWKGFSSNTSTTAPSSHDVTAKYSSIPGNISSILRSVKVLESALQQRGWKGFSSNDL
jgi:cytochrome c551/c552